ncbi:MAG TPA: DUF4139 domain-containing protein [Bacteroidales bacterium]|nr:DUF4139 domain-containing protein [Bacteroidales bacterium]HQH18180.1 DUF4139 domain-containing protein [Bacteroidales bacterium]HQI46779.1 DUF4139 domain-containing protein [Bacteroidales bacterium]
MKKKSIILFSLFISSFFILKAEEVKTPVKSEITEVTVFSNNAQVFRTASINVPVGQTTFVLSGLSQFIDPSSIQVKGTGDYIILSVSNQMNYLNQQEKSKEVKTLEDSLEIYSDKLAYQQGLTEVYTAEKNMIIANQSIGGSNTGIKMDDLKAASDFFRTRLSDIKLKELDIKSKTKIIQEKVTSFTNQLEQMRSKQTSATYEILIVVSSKIKTTGTLEISYMVTNAGWNTAYNLRAENISNPISLEQQANVFQTTGEEWKNVKLTLNSGNPSLPGTKPQLNPWYLYTYNDYPTRNYKKSKESYSKIMQDAGGENASYEEPKPSQTAADYTNININATSFEFQINLPYTISSDGKTTVVDIQQYTLPATYEYYCAPKIDPTAFLIAKVTGWDAYNLLSGNIQLYFEGTYVGESFIDINQTNDTLDISLGRDAKVVVERKKQKELNSKNLIGSSKKIDIAWEISIRNTKKTPITILVEDQIPISNDKEIEVEKGEISNAIYDETKGSLKWLFTLDAADTKKMNFSYNVKYPKTKILYLE